MSYSICIPPIQSFNGVWTKQQQQQQQQSADGRYDDTRQKPYFDFIPVFFCFVCFVFFIGRIISEIFWVNDIKATFLDPLLDTRAHTHYCIVSLSVNRLALGRRLSDWHCEQILVGYVICVCVCVQAVSYKLVHNTFLREVAVFECCFVLSCMEIVYDRSDRRIDLRLVIQFMHTPIDFVSAAVCFVLVVVVCPGEFRNFNEFIM